VATPTSQAGQAAVGVCPTGALELRGNHVAVDLGRCIDCQRCRRGDAKVEWADESQVALRLSPADLPGKAFRHSLHVRVVDAGDGGETLRELKQLTSPYYAVHRLGIFFTPTPRDADVLLVVGPVTQGARRALLDTYEAMPEPKWVMAVGSAAVSGVPFGPSFTTVAGVGEVLPVDVVVPGDPPPPLAILDGLLSLMGRVPAEEMLS
jgi:Ni,Fe-hydrogenase III small subunit